MDKLFKQNLELIALNKKLTKVKEAAVVAIIYEKEGIEYIAVIQRQEYDGHHSGQYALPGGKFDPSDKNLIQTAVREVKEEIGIEIPSENLIYFHEQWVEVSKFIITCFQIKLNKEPTFNLDEKEVNCLFEIPTMEFRKQENLLFHELIYQGKPYKAPYFMIEEKKIWGATAMILIKLFDLKPVI